MEKMATGEDIQTGDLVQLEAGEWVTVTRIVKGIHSGDTILVDWKGKSGAGWSRLFPGEEVPVRRQYEG